MHGLIFTIRTFGNCRAVSCGHVSYVQCIGMKYKRDVVYVYDLELPPDFLPFSNGM